MTKAAIWAGARDVRENVLRGILGVDNFLQFSIKTYFVGTH